MKLLLFIFLLASVRGTRHNPRLRRSLKSIHPQFDKFHIHSYKGGGSRDHDGSNPIRVVRVRLPDGATKRIDVIEGDTVNEILMQAIKGNELRYCSLPNVFLDPHCLGPVVDGDAQLAKLQLNDGAMLYCQRIAQTVKSDSKTTTDSAAYSFRERKGRNGVMHRDWKELSQEQHNLRVKRQLKPKLTRLSIDHQASENLATYLTSYRNTNLNLDLVSQSPDAGKESKPKPTSRIALLFGKSKTVLNSTGEKETIICVDVIWEPPQKRATVMCYDTLALEKALQDSTGALKLARALGYRLVGWLFSHGPRDFDLSGQDLAITAAVRNAVETSDGTVAGQEVVVVAVRDDFLAEIKSDEKNKKLVGENNTVTFEAYQVSDQSHNWFKFGILDNSLLPKFDRTKKYICDKDFSFVKTTKSVIVDGKNVEKVDTAFFTIPVPIVSHTGSLRCTFTPPTSAEHKIYRAMLKKVRFR